MITLRRPNGSRKCMLRGRKLNHVRLGRSLIPNDGDLLTQLHILLIDMQDVRAAESLFKVTAVAVNDTVPIMHCAPP